MSHDHEKFMRPAQPFGAVAGGRGAGEVLVAVLNHSKDSPLRHGEMDAVHRGAVERRVGNWSRAVLYTAAGPCMMCAAASVRERLQGVHGTSIPCLARHGWMQIGVRADEVFRGTPGWRTGLVGGVLEQECNALFRDGR